MLTFEYTKSPDNISSRVIKVLTYPSDKYFGVDLTELDQEDQGRVAHKLHDAYTKYMQEVKSIMAEADIVNNFRYFLANKTSNVVKEEL